MPVKPRTRFPHDCPACVFLGADSTYDYYYCGQGVRVVHPTVIARFGVRGQDYYSGLEIAIQVKETQPEHPLVKAMNLAIERGLCKPKEAN